MSATTERPARLVPGGPLDLKKKGQLYLARILTLPPDVEA